MCVTRPASNFFEKVRFLTKIVKKHFSNSGAQDDFRSCQMHFGAKVNFCAAGPPKTIKIAGA